MNGLTILIPIALALGLCGLAAFFWAMRNGQFDDMDGASMRILIEDEE
ncbi:MAG: cbb3-type cytochrome oxidase assembly protein CcoS [Sphingomonas sp.]|nr:cbb3-type cytochrome oxidase assembly protein CcoS [Sphingomonas sp.]